MIYMFSLMYLNVAVTFFQKITLYNFTFFFHVLVTFFCYFITMTVFTLPSYLLFSTAKFKVICYNNICITILFMSVKCLNYFFIDHLNKLFECKLLCYKLNVQKYCMFYKFIFQSKLKCSKRDSTEVWPQVGKKTHLFYTLLLSYHSCSHSPMHVPNIKGGKTHFHKNTNIIYTQMI